MPTTNITCTDTERTVKADVLEMSPMRMKVALQGTDITLILNKKTPASKYYIGQSNGMEFTSTGQKT